MSAESFPPKISKRIYASALDEQLEQLKTDEQVLRFAESRKDLSGDPYRPAYHYVNPEGELNDPNGLCCWQGRSHLFYQAYPPDDPRQHWGHAVSDDMVRWKDLPLAIYPGIEEKCFSGSALVEDDRVIVMYHGTRAGEMIAVSSDPLLLNWEKIPGNPVIPLEQIDELGRPRRVVAPFIWKETDGYYAISGTFWEGFMFGDCRMAQHLFFSQDLKRWTCGGPFIEGDIFTGPGEDGAVPYFLPIGDKHILLFASHQRGSQYLLGDYDKGRHKFRPFAHGRFNFGQMAHGGVHAPSATSDGKGGVYVIHNINNGRPTVGWNQIMSLGRLLTLREDQTLGIEPVSAVESLRSDHRRVGPAELPANREIVLEGVEGNVMELVAEIDPKGAREICVNVLRSPGGEEVTAIKFYRHGLLPVVGRGGLASRQDALVLDHYGPVAYQQDALALDPSRASLLPDVFARPPEVAPFALKDDEPLKLRIFIDRSVVEVFANGRQCVALRVYPERKDSVGVSIRAQGRDAALRSLEAWRMKSVWE